MDSARQDQTAAAKTGSLAPSRNGRIAMSRPSLKTALSRRNCLAGTVAAAGLAAPHPLSASAQDGQAHPRFLEAEPIREEQDGFVKYRIAL
jgi:hypothetical protein